MRSGDVRELAIPRELDGVSVLRAMESLFEVSSGRARALLVQGAVFLDRRRLAQSKKVRSGQTLRADVAFEPPKVAPLDARVLYNDEVIIAVDKAAGMPSVPTLTAAAGTLVYEVGRQRLCAFEPQEVHRLDAPTSGVILFAKKGKACNNLARAFVEKTVHKRYLARVHGLLSWDEGVITAPLARHRRRRQLWEALEPEVAARRTKCKAAETRYRVLRRDEEHQTTDVCLEPLTGRTHQLRLHMNFLGHPILGDHHYGDRARDRALGVTRLWLHAGQISLKHPTRGTLISVTASPPESMPGFLLDDYT